jgi:membrane dipeptidase
MDPDAPVPHMRSGGVVVFDGHNDTLTRDDADRFAVGRAAGDLDLPRARAGGLAGGVFAIFTPSPGGAAEPVTHGDGGWEVPLADAVGASVAAPYATAAAGRLLRWERDGHVRVARSAADLDAARGGGPMAAVMHLEGAEAIDPGLEALDLWHAAGLRSLGPVWSRPTAFGHGVPFAHPRSPDTGPGLTDAGRRLVSRCADLGIAVDVSHLNAAGVRDVAGLDRAPLVASHSGAHALAPTSRNLTDAQLDLIGGSGGIVGIPFAVELLRADGRADPDTPLAWVVAHARHVADRIGVAHVGLGSDFDGATMPAGLDAAALPRLLDALRDGGFDATEVAAVAWGNWRRVLAACWGG